MFHNIRGFDWQPICYVWWTCISTQSAFIWVSTVLLF